MIISEELRNEMGMVETSLQDGLIYLSKVSKELYTGDRVLTYNLVDNLKKCENNFNNTLHMIKALTS